MEGKLHWLCKPFQLISQLLDAVLAALTPSSVSEYEMVLFKFEPFVLHVRCANIEAGRQFVMRSLQR